MRPEAIVRLIRRYSVIEPVRFHRLVEGLLIRHHEVGQEHFLRFRLVEIDVCDLRL